MIAATTNPGTRAPRRNLRRVAARRRWNSRPASRLTGRKLVPGFFARAPRARAWSRCSQVAELHQANRLHGYDFASECAVAANSIVIVYNPAAGGPGAAPIIPIIMTDRGPMPGEAIAAGDIAAGVGQGILDIANGTQDAIIGTVNTVAEGMANQTGPYNGTIIQRPLPSQEYGDLVPDIPSPDWSDSVLVSSNSYPHDLNKFIGGTSVMILTGNVRFGTQTVIVKPHGLRHFPAATQRAVANAIQRDLAALEAIRKPSRIHGMVTAHGRNAATH